VGEFCGPTLNGFTDLRKKFEYQRKPNVCVTYSRQLNCLFYDRLGHLETRKSSYVIFT